MSSYCGRHYAYAGDQGLKLHTQILPEAPAKPDTATGRLRILATSDLHMHLRGFDYFDDRPTLQGGLARLATAMRAARRELEAEEAVVLTVDNGDSLQGAPIDEHAMAAQDQPHILYRTLAALGYDAAGLGNHDFNFDLSQLAASLKSAPVPMLCSNLERVDGGALALRKHLVLDRELAGQPLRIGLFSVLPPQTLVWDADHLTGRVVINDITQIARQAIADLRADGCDIVIALAHTGLGEDQERAGQENALWPLSRLVGLDAIVAGHTHIALPDPADGAKTDIAQGVLNGTPVVMPGAYGAFLGVIDLDLAHDRSDGWLVIGRSSALRAATGPEDKVVSDLTGPLHDITRRTLARKVGSSPLPLHSYFAFLGISPALAVLSDAMRVAVRDSGCVPSEIPLLSCTSPARMGGRGGPNHYVDIPAGPLSLRHVFGLCYFPNRLAAVVISGAALTDWIEMSAGVYQRITPGLRNQPLLNPDYPPHACDLFDGVDYTLDLTQPARFRQDGSLVHPCHRRVMSLRYQGRDVAADDRFAVALNSYRANGGGNVTALQGADRLGSPNQLIREAVCDYLGAGRFPSRALRSPCDFHIGPGTTVTGPTGPGAQAHLAHISHICEAVHGINSRGFLDLELRL